MVDNEANFATDTKESDAQSPEASGFIFDMATMKVIVANNTIAKHIPIRDNIT